MDSFLFNLQKYRDYEGLPPLPVDAPQEVADVEGASLDPEDVDETEVEDSDEENPPTPGRHQRPMLDIDSPLDGVLPQADILFVIRYIPQGASSSSQDGKLEQEG